MSTLPSVSGGSVNMTSGKHETVGKLKPLSEYQRCPSLSPLTWFPASLLEPPVTYRNYPAVGAPHTQARERDGRRSGSPLETSHLVTKRAFFFVSSFFVEHKTNKKKTSGNKVSVSDQGAEKLGSCHDLGWKTVGWDTASQRLGRTRTRVSVEALSNPHQKTKHVSNQDVCPFEHQHQLQ